ncbi:unnamed protein product [Camellia sinensis]
MSQSLLTLSSLLLLLLSAAAHGGDGDSTTDSPPNLRSRSLILVKIWCLMLVFIGTFIGGISPYFMKWNEGFLVLGTQFAGGVFLGTAMMHFLSDSNSTFGDLTSKPYPFAFMLACAGYLLTMLADSLISFVYGRQTNGSNGDVELQGCDPKDDVLLVCGRSVLGGCGGFVVVVIAIVVVVVMAVVVAVGMRKCFPAWKMHNTFSKKCSVEKRESVKKYLTSGWALILDEYCNGKSNGNRITSQSQYQVHGGTENHFVKAPLPTATSVGDSILLIVALCFHSVFEGIAIGVAETQADAWRALWTVSLHKIFAAVAMGIALLRMIPDRPLLSCAAYAFAFAISSPIGVAIGIIIDATTQGTVADWIYAISMGLACGVFIYVSINHLLSKGYVAPKSVKVDTPHYKFLAAMLGIGVIAVVMIWD